MRGPPVDLDKTLARDRSGQFFKARMLLGGKGPPRCKARMFLGDFHDFHMNSGPAENGAGLPYEFGPYSKASKFVTPGGGSLPHIHILSGVQTIKNSPLRPRASFLSREVIIPPDRPLSFQSTSLSEHLLYCVSPLSPFFFPTKPTQAQASKPRFLWPRLAGSAYSRTTYYN